MTGFVSDIQHFSLVDGPGIRTSVFLKGCNLHCRWCHNPECIGKQAQELRWTNGIVRTAGRDVTVDALVAELSEDLAFYARSGGGATFSGGEPLLQAEFVAAVTERLRALGVDVIIDTAGCVPYDRIALLTPFDPLWYFDYKVLDDDYRKNCGGDSALVEQNLARLVEEGQRVTARIPIVPGVNADPAYQRAMAERLDALGVHEIGLLPFHCFGASKYTALGLTYEFADVPSLRPSALAPIAEMYRAHGFTVRIEE